jgi:hypothetical protein
MQARYADCLDAAVLGCGHPAARAAQWFHPVTS